MITLHLRQQSARRLLIGHQDHPALGKTNYPQGHLSITKLGSSNPKASKCFDESKGLVLVGFFSYQSGPDTYLLQLRDVGFPVRLREYMKVAGSRGPGVGHIISDENGFDWDVRLPVLEPSLVLIR